MTFTWQIDQLNKCCFRIQFILFSLPIFIIKGVSFPKEQGPIVIYVVVVFISVK